MKKKHHDQKQKHINKIVSDLSSKLADEGRIIEAGWAALRIMALPEDAPADQIAEMRKAFMAGAQHLFSSIMVILDPDAEPTEQDMRRLDLISTELNTFSEELKREYSQPKPKPKKPERLGDAPIQKEYVDEMNVLAAFLDMKFNGENKGADRDVGFVLMVFPYGEGDGGRVNYISNGADRRDIVVLMKEMIKRFEGQPEMKGHA